MGRKKAVRSTPRISAPAHRITPFLWFDNQAEQAANFYTSVFSGLWGSKNSNITEVVRYGKAGPGPEGSVMVATFRLEGQEFVALNGGPQFKFTEAISFVINCSTQQEVDYFWDALTAGGEESMCGWLKDKFGLSWQVVPVALNRMLSDRNAEKSRRAMEAMLKMRKIDINEIKRAFDGR